MIDRYAWRGGEEAMLRFGPASGPVVVVAMPLFEEANRTRAFVVALCRGLAERGVASALPDLPGMGESLVATRDASLASWREAFAAAVTSVAAGRGKVLMLSIRGGALGVTPSPVGPGALTAALDHYAIAPIDGHSQVRELLRTRIGRADAGGSTVLEVAGNLVSRALLAELEEAVAPTAGRTVRLASDPLPADLKLEGVPLWRRAEPGQDPGLVARIADDVVAWVRSCGG